MREGGTLSALRGTTIVLWVLPALLLAMSGVLSSRIMLERSVIRWSNNVHSGKGSAKVYGRTDAWQGIKQSILGKVSDGSTYQISGWVKLENADFETAILSIEQTDDSGTNYINVASDTAVKDEWIELSGEFTLNASGTLTTLDVYFEGPEPNVVFFVDDVNVYGPATADKPVPAAPKKENKITASEAQAEVICDSAEINSMRQTALARHRD